jgi:hypothetical protein
MVPETGGVNTVCHRAVWNFKLWGAGKAFPYTSQFEITAEYN